MPGIRALLQVLRHPVPVETRRRLDEAWRALPPALRLPNQFLGRQYAGCGATIGAMPRCDFACRGCYLAAGANSIPAEPVAEIESQLRRLRAWLGEGGNVQLTDGEVTLRPEDEVVRLIRYARGIGLVPMLMTHGDTFRRRPGLLERLLRDGGLSEVSIHIDTTMRGRRGEDYRKASREEDLAPLRDEFAAMIRAARRATGCKLDVATTFTVTRDNLDGVPAVLGWLLANPGVFKMISFQPIAQVGRTEAGLGGSVSAAELWSRIAEGLLGNAARAADLAAHQGLLGHPECSRYVQGIVVSEAGAPPRFVPLYGTDRRDRALFARLAERLGGLTFRLDSSAAALARIAGVLGRHGFFLAARLPAAVARLCRRIDPEHPLRLAWNVLRRRTRLSYLNVVSHHFMSRDEIETPRGQERLGACAFRVPIGGDLVPMCAVNALGIREQHYRGLTPRS